MHGLDNKDGSDAFDVSLRRPQRQKEQGSEQGVNIRRLERRQAFSSARIWPLAIYMMEMQGVIKSVYSCANKAQPQRNELHRRLQRANGVR